MCLCSQEKFLYPVKKNKNKTIISELIQFIIILIVG